MQTLYDRLLLILEDQGRPTRFPGKEIEDIAGISSGRVTQIKQEGMAAGLGPDSLSKLTQLGYSSEWVLRGNGPMKAEFRPFALGHGPTEPDAGFVAINRVLFKLSAGVTGYQVEPLEGNGPPIFFRRDWVEQRGYRADKLFAVKITGASMEPGLFDGDLVVINTADTQPLDGEPFAANYEGELLIKRLKRDSGEWWLTSDNADKRRYPDKRCDENASLIGRVVYKQSERV